MRLEEYNARRVFRENLNRIIKERQLEQQDIASAVQKSPSTVSDWVTGKKYPRIDAMQKLAKALSVPIEELTGNQMPNSSNLILSAYRRAGFTTRSIVCHALGCSYLPEYDDRELVAIAKIGLQNIKSNIWDKSEARTAIIEHYSKSLANTDFSCSIEALDICLKAVSDDIPEILGRVKFDDDINDNNSAMNTLRLIAEAHIANRKNPE